MKTADLYKIILEIDENWSVTLIKLDTLQEEVNVFISYNKSKATDPVTHEECSLYDHREERSWRHLDTMQYKTHIKCCIPRVKNSLGKVNTIPVPWADKLNRFSYLLEKKNNRFITSHKEPNENGITTSNELYTNKPGTL